MITVSVPTPKHLGELPADVEVVPWDGLSAPPEAAERIEYFVGRYNAAPPPREVLAALPALQTIQLVSAGVERWLPVIPDGVRLCNGRGIHGASTAELAIAGLLAILRELPQFRAEQDAHDWRARDTDGLAGRRVLVLGVGDIGARIARIAEILDATVTLVASTARDGVHGIDEVPDLLPTHDVVVVALPHTPATHGLVDAPFLAAMPDHAVFVNIARGGIVDTDALLGELTAGRLRAFLDVTDPEPLPADHPLWDAPNLLITPHIGGGTRGWEARAYGLIHDQIMRLRAGEELVNQVRHGY